MAEIILMSHLPSVVSEAGMHNDVELAPGSRDLAGRYEHHMEGVSTFLSSSYRSAIETTYTLAAASGVRWRPLLRHEPFFPSFNDHDHWQTNVERFLTGDVVYDLEGSSADNVKKDICFSVETTLKALPDEQLLALIGSPVQLALLAEASGEAKACSAFKMLHHGEVLKVSCLKDLVHR
ncbi:hypothetical protein [Alkalicoccus luteus]|uniref:Uncharacterized protein n=1 Tax=Alkalicoccus luteus TaxID=1237094 RepID=A0A969TWD2_9BACI|nr:hypothetical protein [Alkalicoccus luteus]NJP38946.1 hypothetical protein [Alkalicoccus luteus]